MEPNKVTIDLRVFPLPIVKNALYVLSDRVDGRIGKLAKVKAVVTLRPNEAGIEASEAERLFHQALISSSVNEFAFSQAAPIRNLLAQTALSITTENQQALADFAASMSQQETTSQHAGSAGEHVNIAMSEFDARAVATEAGNRIVTEEESGRVLLFIDTRRYLLPDVLWAAHAAHSTISCSVDYMTGNRLIVCVRPLDQSVPLVALASTFEHWLEIAVERPL